MMRCACGSQRLVVRSSAPGWFYPEELPHRDVIGFFYVHCETCGATGPARNRAARAIVAWDRARRRAEGGRLAGLLARIRALRVYFAKGPRHG